MKNNNPFNIPPKYALDIDATYWQKIYVHLALEKAGYRMFATTKERFLSKNKLNNAPYTNLVKGSIIYHEDKMCCHFSTGASILRPFDWWKEKIKPKKWSQNTFLDEQIKSL